MTQETHLFCDPPYAMRRMRDDAGDYALIARWLSDARVLEFYEGRDQPYSLERATLEFSVPQALSEGLTPCILEYESEPVGYLQFYPADSHEYFFEEADPAYAFDLFIGEASLWGRGIGTHLILHTVKMIFETCQPQWILIDPHVDNLRAIRVYEKCGFRIVKRLPKHEQHEGQRVDCWLMALRRA